MSPTNLQIFLVVEIVGWACVLLHLIHVNLLLLGSRVSNGGELRLLQLNCRRKIAHYHVPISLRERSWRKSILLGVSLHWRQWMACYGISGSVVAYFIVPYLLQLILFFQEFPVWIYFDFEISWRFHASSSMVWTLCQNMLRMLDTRHQWELTIVKIFVCS